MGAFVEIYGNTIHNRILEYLLENQSLDFAVPDLARELCISKPKVYELMELFIKKNLVIKSRIIGKTQLYKLNKENGLAQFFLKNFRDCLKLVSEPYIKKQLLVFKS